MNEQRVKEYFLALSQAFDESPDMHCLMERIYGVCDSLIARVGHEVCKHPQRFAPFFKAGIERYFKGIESSDVGMIKNNIFTLEERYCKLNRLFDALLLASAQLANLEIESNEEINLRSFNGLRARFLDDYLR